MEQMIAIVVLAIATVAIFFSNIKLRRKLTEVQRESAQKQLDLERRVDKYREKYLFAESQREREREVYRESLDQKTKDPSYNRLRELSGQRPLPTTGLTSGTRPTTSVDTGPDLITQMIILDALNSPSGTAAGTVSYTEIESSSPEPEKSSPSSSYSSSSSDSYSSSSDSGSSSSDSGPSSSW
jgi:uncharacterized membrane protein YgcG